MSKLHTTTAAIVACLALVAGCGGPSEAEQKAAAEKKAAAAEKKEAERVAAERAEQQVAHDDCQTAVQDFSDAVTEVNSRLAIGLNYQEYGEKVGNIKVAYDRLDLDAMGDACVRATLPLEKAYNAYADALNVWSRCMKDINCDFNEGPANDKVQVKWAKAGIAIKKHQRKLDALAPEDE